MKALIAAKLAPILAKGGIAPMPEREPGY